MLINARVSTFSFAPNRVFVKSVVAQALLPAASRLFSTLGVCRPLPAAR